MNWVVLVLDILEPIVEWDTIKVFYFIYYIVRREKY